MTNKKAIVSEQVVINNLVQQLANMQLTLAMKDAYIQQLEAEINKPKQEDAE